MGFWSLPKEQYYFLRQRKKFRKCHGYELDLENPGSFNEKIFWRKVFDRNPVFPLLTDKYRSREFVIERLGEEAGGKILVPLLFVTGNPEEIPFDDLPEEYIVKPNHGSGWSIIVDKQHQVSRENIVSQCRKWLRKTYGRSKMEWSYSQVKPLIMVEKLLKDRCGRLAPNFKFFVFHGRVEMIDLFYDHFREQAFYDRDFRKLDVKRHDAKYSELTGITKPECFEEMVSISERLGSGLDFLRVDLYHLEGKIFFGEFTIYPASGLGPYEPSGFDRSLGQKWELNREFARSFKPWSRIFNK
ncbi:MAG: hypothetical protein JW755_04565 [Candidatus Aminicenantes bacterium]|nr:hypothetical protein [Candidatus Aminicenantes bacterium]